MNAPTSNNTTNGTEKNRWDLARLVMYAGALTATLSAYLAIVAFAHDVLGQSMIRAYALSGVFELAMMAVMLEARKSARAGRPHLHLSIIAIIMACISGTFAGWEELHAGNPWAAAVFRFIVAITGALLWELSLVGDRQIASGISWREARQRRRMQALQEAAEAIGRAKERGYPAKIIRRYEDAYDRKRSSARRLVLAEDMGRFTQAQEASSDATVDHLVHTLNGQSRERAALDGRIPTRPTQRRTVNATPVASPDPVAQVEAAATDDDATTPATPVLVAAASAPARTTVTAPVSEDDYPTGPGTPCWGCGKLIEAHRTQRAKYCDLNAEGKPSQACKGSYKGGDGFRPNPSA